MEPLCKIARTPVGNFLGPMDPGFTRRLAPCKTIDDLFYLCKDTSGFLDPDAFNEIRERGLVQEFERWLDANAPKVDGGYKCRKRLHLWWGVADAIRCCDGIHTRAFDTAHGRHHWVREEENNTTPA